MSDCACVDIDLVASLEDLKERAGESKNQLEFCKRRPPVKEGDEGGTRLYNVGVIRKSFPTQKIVRDKVFFSKSAPLRSSTSSTAGSTAVTCATCPASNHWSHVIIKKEGENRIQIILREELYETEVSALTWPSAGFEGRAAAALLGIDATAAAGEGGSAEYIKGLLQVYQKVFLIFIAKYRFFAPAGRHLLQDPEHGHRHREPQDLGESESLLFLSILVRALPGLSLRVSLQSSSLVSDLGGAFSLMLGISIVMLLEFVVLAVKVLR